MNFRQSSPEATAEIFNDLKLNHPQPSRERALAIGSDMSEEDNGGINQTAEELLRCLPGIDEHNVRLVMKRIQNVREFTEMTMEQVQKILGEEKGKNCWEFMHKGER